MTRHPWKLVSPWYRTGSVGGEQINRNTVPILQKYADTDFANRLVREPQESLKFTGEDFVNRITLDPDRVITPAMYASNREPFKLFLDLHGRFYIVVAELHCDLPGFPNVSREEVCEAGFVIRRRVPVVPVEAAADVARNRWERNRLKKKLLKTGSANSTIQNPALTLGELMKAGVDRIGDQFRQHRFAQVQASLKENADDFARLTDSYAFSLRLEGWVPSTEKGIGSWVTVEETTQELQESIIPMYPLIADPTVATHSATGRCQWFGVIPTSSSDVDSLGASRFSDNVLYEIRCVVRRHKLHCPKKTNQTDCTGELIYSLPTDAYQIASAYDLDGASHRPFNIIKPDFRTLRDQAELGPPGRGVNTRVTTPEGGAIDFKTAGGTSIDMPSKGSSGGQEICFYFYLIFFIVAFFLFQLFLPILMFVLQLWFLLTLRLCIPPSIGFDADIAADLKLQGDLGVKLDAGIDVEFDAGAGIGTYSTRDSLKEAIANSLADGMALEGDLKNAFGEGLRDDTSMSVDDVGNLFINMATDFSDDPEREELAGDPPTPERGLVYFDKVPS